MSVNTYIVDKNRDIGYIKLVTFVLKPMFCRTYSSGIV